MNKKNNTHIESLKKNFWSKVQKTKSCWLWTGKIRKDGYGVLSINYKAVRAHRISIFLLKGNHLTPSEKVCHKCDVPSCVRPSHLFVGTQTDNLRDMRNKDRNVFSRKGTQHPSSKFAKAQIKTIREWAKKGITQKKIAEHYQCAQQTISRIVTKKRYA